MKFTRLADKLTSMFETPTPKYMQKKKALPTFDWKFGSRSLQKLQGVDDGLVRVCHLALTYSSVDFGITCGLRSQAEQNQLRAQGKSQAKHSRHQDGMAIDIVCYVDGKVTWDFKHYMVAAQAIAIAARELGVTIRWGAAWTTTLNETDARKAHEDYVSLRKSEGNKPFIDGPHFEIPK
jgi:peptidoglycan L-alanyl-D-glutamate endopeptidase CwlK